MSSIDDALGGLAKSAVIVFFGTVAGRALGLLGQIFIVRSLDPTSFGHIALAYTVISTSGGLGLLGIHEGVTRLLSSERTQQYQHRVLRSGYLLTLGGSFVLMIILYVFRFQLSIYLNNDQLPRLIVLFFPYIIAYSIARVSFGALRSYKRSGAAVVTRDLGPRIGGILIFGALAYVGQAYFGAIVYWVSVPLIMAILSGYYLSQELSISHVVFRLPNLKTTRDLLMFSWPLAVGASFFLLLSNIDVLMISYFLQPRSVGLYRAIQPLRQVTTFVLVAFTFLFLPLATEFFDDGNLNDLDRLYTVTTKWIVITTFPFVLVFTLFAPSIITSFFGTEYTAAAPALAVLTGGLFVRTIVGLNGDMTKAIDRPRIELYSVVVAVVVNIFCNIFLIPRYGIVGAALGTAIGYAVYNGIELVGIYLAVESHPFSMDSIKPLVPTFLFALGVRQFVHGENISFVMLLGIGIGISCVQAISLVLTRSVSQSDIVLFERFEERTGFDLSWIKSVLRTYV
ncbi:flippase [Halorubrum tropicale]|uniref:flippase n=1 Tax=Halorubrum tropicale TaxID=1765655 RepID=UPI00097F7356|nr:flippase [Halorubrum tropicale]